MDRDLALSVLRGALAMENWPSWRRDPHEYSGMIFFGLLTPFLHRLLPEDELVASTVAKLREVPSVFAVAEANLDVSLASPLVVQRAMEQVRTGRSFVLDSLPLEVSSPTLRAQLVEAAAPAAEAFMVSRTALTPGTAFGEVKRYCAWPTQAPSYLTGALEIDLIRDEYLAAELGSLRDFHDRIAGSGALPLGLARRVALGED